MTFFHKTLVVVFLMVTTASEAAQHTFVLRFKTYEISYLQDKASIARVDKIFSDCAVARGEKLIWAEPGETAAQYLKLILGQSFTEASHFEYTLVTANTENAKAAVQAIFNPVEDTAEYLESRQQIYKALNRTLVRQPWLNLYVGKAFNEQDRLVAGYFIVVDERNLEFLIVGDGICSR